MFSHCQLWWMSSALLPWGAQGYGLTEKDTSWIWRELCLRQEIYCSGPAETWASELWARSAGLFIALFGQCHPEDHKHLFYSCTLVLFVTCKTINLCLVPWAFDVWRIPELRLQANVRSKSHWVHLILTAFSYTLLWRFLVSGSYFNVGLYLAVEKSWRQK